VAAAMSDASFPRELDSPLSIPGKRDAVFAAIVWTNFLPYEDYEDVKLRDQQHNLVLLVNRWDGRIGFPGGKVEEGESHLQALERELLEEVGFDVALNQGLEPEALHWLCSHELEKVVVHLYVLHSGMSPRTALHSVSRADHALSETCGAFVLHLADYSLPTLKNSNMLASAVREELEALERYMQNRTAKSGPQVTDPSAADLTHTASTRIAIKHLEKIHQIYVARTEEVHKLWVETGMPHFGPTMEELSAVMRRRNYYSRALDFLREAGHD